MFQSSRIASGSLRRHAFSACSPSSASSICNSSPSRMRRATLRMTLESSTTKQVRIDYSSYPLYCGRGGFDLQHAVHVAYHKQMTVEQRAPHSLPARTQVVTT